jgi:hypothetical protein
MHYKYKFNRPRPSQLSNRIMPPIDPPGHASYPSGHATEAYLVSGLLGLVMQLNDPAAPPPGSLERLADRIARNREVLGVHYRSDSEAGRDLAAKTLPLLRRCTTVTQVIGAAAAEWSNNANYPANTNPFP